MAWALAQVALLDGLANVGEVLIRIRPGMKICQVLVQPAPEARRTSKGQLNGRRHPYLGVLNGDSVLRRLSTQCSENVFYPICGDDWGLYWGRAKQLHPKYLISNKM
jgi:hypothetical protein